MKAPIPMSATRLKTIREYIRITFKGTKEEFDLHGVLESNNENVEIGIRFAYFKL